MSLKKQKINLFDIINWIFMLFLIFVTLYPFIHVTAVSFSSRGEALREGWHFYPKEVDLSAYKRLLVSSIIWRGFYNSVLRTFLGTVIALFLTALTAYPLSKKNMPCRKLFNGLILFTMLFSGGIIPSYLLIKQLNMVNTIWALVIPGAISAYNVIIMRNFFMSIPESLEESAMIDGASVFRIWVKIVIPLSKPVLATIALWTCVGYWNAYFDALIYITDRSKMVLQVILRRMLLDSQIDMFAPQTIDTNSIPPPDIVVQSSLIVITTVPIVIVYPFLQKYFTKGILIGAVKG